MAVWNTINLSSLENFKDFSSEYYKKDHIQKSKLIRRIGTVKVGKIAYITDGEHGSPCWSDTSGIKYITAEFIKENYIEQGQFRQISEEQDRRNIRARLQSGDILIYSVGAYAGLAAVAEPHLFPANIPRSVAIIRINKKNELKSEYVATFLNSIFGKFQTLRLRAGNSQPVLALDKIKQLEIPIIEEKYQKEIQNYYQQAYKARILSQSLYHQAEELLARELQLDQLQLPNKKWYTTRYCEVVGNGRCDGEYYQPKYKQLMEHLSKFKCKTLGSLCDFNKGFEIGSSSYKDHGKLFMRVSNISENGIHLGNSDKYLSDFDFHRLKLFQIEKGDVLCTKDGTIAMCYVIDEEIEGIFSSGIVKLSLNEEIPTEYLAIVINSVFGKMQANRDCSGALITHWKIREMKKIQIPIIASTSMNTIADYVIQSKAAKRQSKQLLAQAKRRVEEMIEQEANKNK